MKHPLIFLFGALAALTGCGDDESTGTPDVAPAAITNYARIVQASYEDSASLAGELDDRIGDFIEDPSDSTLEDAREAWLAAREPYLQTEVYRFYGGPIDDEDDGPEGMINAWPLDEAYVDYTLDAADSGIVNDPSVDISAEELASLNEQGGEQNIATGFHAVEFLLWGQDGSTTGPGDRPATDYVTDGSGTAENQDRRAEYLQTVSNMLLGHLEGLADAWTPDADYPTEMAAAPTDDALSRILTGMIVLSGFETGGERLQTALDSGDQEDEHSCFSDNTHRDMVQDVQGVLNVFLGTYTRLDGTVVSGKGIRDVIAAKNAGLASHLGDHIEESLELANDLVPPFDQEIALDNDEGRERVQALIDALREQEEVLEEVFTELGLTIPEAT